MKRILIALICSLFLISLVSCKKKNSYTPVFTLADGYVLEEDCITATLIGECNLRIRDFILCSDAITVFDGSSADQYVQGLDAQIPLHLGKNRMVIRFSNGTQEKEYDFEINCISIQSFSVTIKNPDRTYHIGEAFDKSTISVLAVTEDGEEIEVKHYTPQYEFSTIGKNTVSIELDGFYESFSVMVTEEYRPTLDVNGAADGVFYRIDGENAILLNGQKKEGFFAVPAEVVKDGKAYPVTEIASHAFTASWITDVTVPETVRIIGDEAFAECRALEWIELPEEMISIGTAAFRDCEELLSVSIPNGITELKSAVFHGCKALASVTLPSSLRSIAGKAFRDCVSLDEIRFPKGTLSIGDEAFHSCKKLSTVIVESSDHIGNNAFAYCDALTHFCIGSVGNTGIGVFTGSESVTVYAPRSGEFLSKAADSGAKTIGLNDGEYQIVSLPIEFPIEEDYPYEQTVIVQLTQGKLRLLTDYTVEYPEDACGYLDATITEGDFSHTFTIFISYTEELILDTDSRGVSYFLDHQSGKAVLVQAPEWLTESNVYTPKTEGLFLVPTTLWSNGYMYVVVSVEEGALDHTNEVEKIFIPILTKES